MSMETEFPENLCDLYTITTLQLGITNIPKYFVYCINHLATRERLSMVCAPVWRDNPRALARGLSIVQAHKPCSISLVPQKPV